MNAEQTEEIKPEEQENTENHTSIITFNQRLDEKIISKELSLKDPRNFMRKLDELLT